MQQGWCFLENSQTQMICIYENLRNIVCGRGNRNDGNKKARSLLAARERFFDRIDYN